MKVNDLTPEKAVGAGGGEWTSSLLKGAEHATPKKAASHKGYSELKDLRSSRCRKGLCPSIPPKSRTSVFHEKSALLGPRREQVSVGFSTAGEG